MLCKSLRFGKDDSGRKLAVVFEGDQQIGTFILDTKDPDQIKIATDLGVDMRYACYAYEAATGEKP